MKKLTYKIEGYTGVYDPETEEVEQRPSLASVIIEKPTDEDVTRAVEIAYNGEYTIEDDGQPEPEVQPTQEERIAELEGMMNALLGVSE